jgi:hypothetical protein
MYNNQQRSGKNMQNEQEKKRKRVAEKNEDKDENGK